MQFSAEFYFDSKQLCKVTINVEKNFQKLGFSRSFTISEIKDKVNYNFLEGAKFPKRGPYLGKLEEGAKIPKRGPNFWWGGQIFGGGANFWWGGQISCDTGSINDKSHTEIKRITGV